MDGVKPICWMPTLALSMRIYRLAMHTWPRRFGMPASNRSRPRCPVQRSRRPRPLAEGGHGSSPAMWRRKGCIQAGASGRSFKRRLRSFVSFRHGCLTSSGPPDTVLLRGQSGTRPAPARKETRGSRRHSEAVPPLTTRLRAGAWGPPAGGSSTASTPRGSSSLPQGS